MIGRMNHEAHYGSFWVEDISGKVQTTLRKKRKYTPKKKEYNGWGSTILIQFLSSIGRDTSNKLTQSEVTNIISDYVKQNNLLHPTKKKRIQCDGRLHTLFGRKSISRLKISDLLESHFMENCGNSSDDVLFDSEDDENAFICETPKPASSERKIQRRKPIVEKPRSCFAAINPFNIKLVYLKRSLVAELLKDPENLETKVVGNFIRIKCDPNDYLQKNSHQLLQVTGIKKSSGVNGEIRFQASGFIKDISVHMLSDDNFSEEECEDLHQRVKDGLLKRPMIVDMEEKARVLHVDMTKHWLARELALLQNLIERANEKGWRRELDEYLRKREKLQSLDEQERLLNEIPQVIADDLDSESTTPDDQDQNVGNDFQESWQTNCMKTPLVTEVPIAAADGFACKPTELYRKLQNPDEEEGLLHEDPRVTAGDPESESKTPDVRDKNVKIIEFCAQDKKVGNDFQELWQNNCVKTPLVTEVPKADADGVASKPTELYKKLRNPDEQEWVLHEAPRVTAGDLDSKSKTPDVSDKNVTHIELWRSVCTKAPLVTEVPKAVLNGFAHKSTNLDIANLKKQETNSPKSILSLSRASEVPRFNLAMNTTMLNRVSHVTAAVSGVPIQQQPGILIDFACKDSVSKPAESNKANISQEPPKKQVPPSQVQVIELSDDDDEENEKPSTIKQVSAELWFYRDPQGQVQGPFPISSLKRWNDSHYFAPDFKVWNAGGREEESVLLVKVLSQFFPYGLNCI